MASTLEELNKKGKTIMNRKRNILLLILVGIVLLNVRHVNADFTFGEPVNLKEVIPIIDPAHESIDCFSSDGLEIYIESDRSGGSGGYDLWRLRRDSVDDDWDPLENLGPLVNSSYSDADVAISADGLTLYFGSKRPGGHGKGDIYMTMRRTRDDPWGEAVNIGQPINSPDDEGGPCIAVDGLELYFGSDRSGGYGDFDIYISRRVTANEPWGKPENLGPTLNSPSDDWIPFISTDGLVLCFSSFNRTGGYGGTDIWMARRESLSYPWNPPVNLGPEVNSPEFETWARISPDGSTLYFFKMIQNDTMDNWLAPIIPIVDLNDDGIVNSSDICIMVEHWLTDYPLCDIGPMPWGDGIVDIQDLIVLAEHLFEETIPVE